MRDIGVLVDVITSTGSLTVTVSINNDITTKVVEVWWISRDTSVV